jgi:hypothetical protein
MEYRTPVIRLVGQAQTLVLGQNGTTSDNPVGGSTFEGTALGLDD